MVGYFHRCASREPRIAAPRRGKSGREQCLSKQSRNSVSRLDVALQRYRPDRGPKVEQALWPDAEPIAQVVGVGQGGREADESDVAVGLGRDVAHSADDDL